MTNKGPLISVLLPTFNSEKIVRRCLDSVKWADEILVVDSFSQDHTLDICSEFGARIIQHEYINSAKQKNWAIPQCKYEWILQLDTDEVIEDGLHREVLTAISEAPPELQAFRIPRKNHLLGEWVDVANLYPDYQTRLFRRDVARFEDKEVHAHVRVPEQVGTLQHHILHYGMVSISNQLRNMDRYSRYQADEFNKRGKRFRWTQITLRPFAIFGYYFFWKCGFRAGMRGFLSAAIATTFDFWTHAKLWEIQALKLETSPR